MTARSAARAVALAAAAAVALAACTDDPAEPAPEAAATRPAVTATEPPVSTAAPLPTPTATPSAVTTSRTAPRPARPARFGNPQGRAAVPAAGRSVATSDPDSVVGSGTPSSCTSAAVVDAVAEGGIVTFDCGPKPVTIQMTATARIDNRASKRVVIDGGGLVTLSGQGKRRILYQNTCDADLGWTTSHCNDQDHPRLTVQNITLAYGNSTGQDAEGGGGGAIFARGGRLTIVNTRFSGNRCDGTGPDLGGAAVRALDQSADLPVHVVQSTFTGGSCANGGALSSIGVSWEVLNSVFTNNQAVGRGANPARAGTPGGGSGGAIYADGDRFTVHVAGTRIEENRAREGGGAIFFVSNDRTGSLLIEDSTLAKNPSDGFENSPGVFFLGARLVR